MTILYYQKELGVKLNILRVVYIKSLVEKDGGIHFWVKSRGSLMMSFDIIPNGDGGDIRLHMYHSFGKYDKYYDAHLATQKEIQLLLEYGISISF